MLGKGLGQQPPRPLPLSSSPAPWLLGIEDQSRFLLGFTGNWQHEPGLCKAQAGTTVWVPPLLPPLLGQKQRRTPILTQTCRPASVHSIADVRAVL